MLNDLMQYYFHTTLGVLELVASALTIICVFQLAKQNIWNFLWGSIAVILFGYIFYKSHLYADTVLQWGYYLPIQFFGAWFWYYQGDEGKNTLHPRGMTHGEQVLTSLSIILGTGIVGTLFWKYTNASYPGWDSFILVASVVAQYLLSKKFTENWVLWIMVDIVAIPLYFVKELYVTSGLYVILLCICIYGIFQWMDSEIVDEVEDV